jgi:O-antigen/teichoic acid export membrane protein
MSIVSNIKEISKHGSIYLGGWAINVVLRLALLPVFTRYLDKTEYGTLAILDSAIEIIKILCALGLGTAIIRFFHDAESEKERNKFVSTGIIVMVCISIFSGTLLFSVRTPLTNLILGPGSPSLYFTLCVITMLFQLVRTGTDSYLMAKKASTAFIIANTGQALLASSLNLYLIVFQGMGVLGMLLGNLISAAIVNIILLVIVLNKVRIRIDVDIFIKMLRFSLPLVLSVLAAAGMHNLDRFFIRNFTSMAEVGLYSLAYQFPFMLNSIFATSFEGIWGGNTIYKIANEPDGIFQYKRICTYYMGFLGFAMYCISIASYTVVTILAAPEYIDAAKYIPVISFGVWLYSFHIFAKTGVMLTKKTYLFSVNYTLALIVNITANIMLIPLFGAMGAAIATVITYGFFSIAGYAIYKHCYALEFEWVRLSIIPSIGIILVVLRFTFQNTGFISTCLTDIIFIIIYPIIFLMLPGFLTAGERKHLSSFKSQKVKEIILTIR